MSGYKCVVARALTLARVVNYAYRETLQIVASLSYNPKFVIYYCKMFIVQVTVGTLVEHSTQNPKVNDSNLGTDTWIGNITIMPLFVVCA